MNSLFLFAIYFPFRIESANSSSGSFRFKMNLISPAHSNSSQEPSSRNWRSFFVTFERNRAERGRLPAWTVRIFRCRSQSRKLYGNGKSLEEGSLSNPSTVTWIILASLWQKVDTPLRRIFNGAARRGTAWRRNYVDTVGR